MEGQGGGAAQGVADQKNWWMKVIMELPARDDFLQHYISNFLLLDIK
jgi:hypothetical protein